MMVVVQMMVVEEEKVVVVVVRWLVNVRVVRVQFMYVNLPTKESHPLNAEQSSILTHSIIHPPDQPTLTHSLTHSLTHPTNPHSLTHSPTHPPTHSPNNNKNNNRCSKRFNRACAGTRLRMGVHSQRQKKRKAFQMATLFIPDCLHIITVNPSQLFSSGTFVAKGKLKKFNCVDAHWGLHCE